MDDLRESLLSELKEGAGYSLGISKKIAAIRRLHEIFVECGGALEGVAMEVGITNEQADSLLRHGDAWGLFQYPGAKARKASPPRAATIDSPRAAGGDVRGDPLADKARRFVEVCGGYEQASEYLGYAPKTVCNIVSGGPVGRHARADIAKMLADSDFALHPEKHPKKGFIRIVQPGGLKEVDVAAVPEESIAEEAA